MKPFNLLFFCFLLTPSAFAFELPFTGADCLSPGRAIKDGELPSPADLALDAFCAEDLVKRAAPNGFVAVFGSARDNLPGLDYKLTENFSAAWTRSPLGARFPIATAGGAGMMAAANKGAREAGGRSLGFPTRFGNKGVEKSVNPFVTDFYLFSSFGQRETELIDRAAAVVVAPGGVGTAWEILESVTKMQTGKKNRAPILLLGKEKDWAPVKALLQQMTELGTIKAEDMKLLEVVETADQAVSTIQNALK